MSQAYKCDKCGELFAQREQDISVTFKKKNDSYLNVSVGQGHDLCRQCIAKALKEAMQSFTIK